MDRQRFGYTSSHTFSGGTKRERRHALFLIYLTASDISGVLLCALHMQGRSTERVQAETYAASLQGQISGSVSKALPGDVII